jgi:hypothetical protein
MFEFLEKKISRKAINPPNETGIKTMIARAIMMV